MKAKQVLPYECPTPDCEQPVFNPDNPTVADGDLKICSCGTIWELEHRDDKPPCVGRRWSVVQLLAAANERWGTPQGRYMLEFAIDAQRKENRRYTHALARAAAAHDAIPIGRRYEWRDTDHGPQLWSLERNCWALWYGIGAIGISDDLKGEIDAALNPCWGAADEFVASLREQLDRARYCARVLAHAYEHDSRPPDAVVKEALNFPTQRRLEGDK